MPTAAMAASTDDLAENEKPRVPIGDLGEPPGIAGHRRDAAGGGADHGFGHESRDFLRSEAQNFRLKASIERLPALSANSEIRPEWLASNIEPATRLAANPAGGAPRPGQRP